MFFQKKMHYAITFSYEVLGYYPIKPDEWTKWDHGFTDMYAKNQTEAIRIFKQRFPDSARSRNYTITKIIVSDV